MEPIFNKNYNCLDTTLANVAKYYKRDHELMFLGSWGFRFLEDANLPMEKRLKTDWKKTRDYLLTFHGIQEENNENLDYTLQDKIISANLDNNEVVAVKMDAYSCLWNLAYGKYHIPHFFLIVGREDDDYICIDTYSSEREERLSVNTAFNSVYTFQCMDITNTFSVLQAANLLGSIDFLRRIDIQRNMILNFANNLIYIDFDNIASLVKEVWASPICRKIKEIGCGRKNFLLAVNYLENKTNKFNMTDIKTDMNEIILYWDKIYRLFIKASFLKERKRILSRIQELLGCVAEAESSLATQIVNIFSIGGAYEE